MNRLNKLTLTLLSFGVVTGMTACAKNDKPATTTTASTVASTVAVAPKPIYASTTPSNSTIVASTVVLKASTPAPMQSAMPVTPASAVANAITKDVTATTQPTAQPPSQASVQPVTTNTRTPLQADLITLIATGQNLQKDAVAKQATMQKELQQKAKTIKTPEAQRKVQKEMLTDVVAYKTKQKQQLQSIALSEPRVKAVRDKMVSSLNSDIKATQIVLNSPTPTAQTQKSFTDAMKKMEADNAQAAQQLQKLLKEAGMANDTPTVKAKK